MQSEEQKWLALALQGDSQSFSRLVEMHAKPVYNLCYRMLGNPQDAEDAAQEAFLRAYRAIQRYDPQRKFLTWLLSIAANYCIDQHRRVRPVSVAFDDAPLDSLTERKLGPEGELIRKEMRDEVQALLGLLEPRDRAALILFYWHEFSYEEISKQLNLSESALKSRLHRARRTLASAIKIEEAKGTSVPKRRTHEAATL